MIATWVLIAFLKSGYGGGAGAFSQEFTSKEKCEAAISIIKEEWWHGSLMICVEK